MGILAFWSQTVLRTTPWAFSQPDIGQDITNPGGDQFRHALGTLGQYLVVVTRRVTYYLPDIQNELVSNPLMKQVAHIASRRLVISLA